MNTWWFNYFVYDDVNIDLIYSFSNINHLMFFSHPMQWMSLWGIYHSISHSGSRYEIYIDIPPCDTLCSGFHCETYTSLSAYIWRSVCCVFLWFHMYEPCFLIRWPCPFLLGIRPWLVPLLSATDMKGCIWHKLADTPFHIQGDNFHIYIVDGVFFAQNSSLLDDLWQKPEVLQIICGSVRVKHITANNDTDV